MKKLRVKTFMFGLDISDSWDRIAEAIEGLNVHTINTTFIPADIQEVPILVSGEAASSKVRIVGRPYMLTVVWYWYDDVYNGKFITEEKKK